MSVFNSSAYLNQEDADITIINHSFLYNHNDEPISACIPVLRRLNQASKSINNPTNTDSKPDFMMVEQDLLETAKQIERILNYYRQELKQESNTQLNCNQQLITRLIDFIRPAYSSQRNKLHDLDVLFEELCTLHDERFIEQKEKTEQLQSEIVHLKKLIITSANEDDGRYDTMTKIYRINSMVNYEQWMEMEEETKKLHNLVEAQRNQIDKLIGLLSQTDIVNNEKHHTSTNRSSQKSIITRKCTLCNHEFPQSFNEAHIEQCPSTIGVDNVNISLDLRQWECPYCNEKFQNADETIYLLHLSQCYNEATGDFS